MRQIVVTGVGVASPIGIGREAFWTSLMEGRSGVERISTFDPGPLPMHIAGEVRDFDAKQYVTPRKSLKVMSRDIQLGFTAAVLAMKDARLSTEIMPPERLGVVFGGDMIYCELDEVAAAIKACVDNGKFHAEHWGSRAMGELYPLWMLKYLPNMPACHVAIAQDARGPNNTIVLNEVSSVAAVAEGMRVIERGQADAMLVGGASCRIHPTTMTARQGKDMSRRNDNPHAASRPFDANRDGMVDGEGAAALVIETREHAEARGATILARLASYASLCEPLKNGQLATGRAIRGVIDSAPCAAGLTANDVGHVNAHGLSTVHDDKIEAQAIRDRLGDVPVTAIKSYFGHLGASGGAAELVATVLGLAAGKIPATLNYENPDPECPVNVIHGAPLPVGKPVAVKLNHAPAGQAMALVITRD